MDRSFWPRAMASLMLSTKYQSSPRLFFSQARPLGIKTRMGHGEQRLRHWLETSARRGNLSARTGSFCSRAALALFAGGYPKNDGVAGMAPGLERPRTD